MSRRGEPTPKKPLSAAQFLAVYRRNGNRREACEAVGINRGTYYDWRRDDPDFDAACKHAEQEALDSLEQVGWERARETSDTLLIFFLKAGRPAKYRDQHLVSVVQEYQNKSDDELTELLARRLGEVVTGGEDRPALPAGEAASGE